MGDSLPELAVLGSALALGLRHGVDYDHIAAIMDLSSVQRRPAQGVWLSILYVLGHGLTVLVFGCLAVALSYEIPARLDFLMGRAVGVTLFTLGLVVLYSLVMARAGAPLSRGRLALEAFKAVRRLVLRRGASRQSSHRNAGYGLGSAMGLGVIHGAGAETPSQLVLFVLAAGFAGTGTGLLLVAMFLAGMFIANMAFAVTVTFGYGSFLGRPALRRSLLAATAAYSLAVGLLFMGGLDRWMPTLL